jgi:hypothetical protein
MSDQNQPQQPEVDNFALLVERTKKTLKKHPNMGVADFVNGFLFPLFAEIRTEIDETRAGVDDLWDYIGEIPEEPLLDEIEQSILGLAGFLDNVLVRAGWLSAGGPTDAFPQDMRDQFIALGKKLAEVQERISQARLLAASDDEDEDEDDGEADESEGEAAPASDAQQVTTKPAEA